MAIFLPTGQGVELAASAKYQFSAGSGTHSAGGAAHCNVRRPGKKLSWVGSAL